MSGRIGNVHVSVVPYNNAVKKAIIKAGYVLPRAVKFTIMVLYMCPDQ